MGRIKVFTDGSCIGNGKPTATAGIGVYFPKKQVNDVSDPFFLAPITNQRAELYAIYVALDKIKDVLGEDTKVHIYSDSNYSIKTLTEWRFNWVKNGKLKAGKVSNTDILFPLFEIVDSMDVKFTHVYSHTGKQDEDSLGNEEADKLANAGRVKGEKFTKGSGSNVSVKITKPVKKPKKSKKPDPLTVDTTVKSKMRLSDLLKLEEVKELLD